MMPNGQKGVSTGTLVVLPAVVAWALVAVGVVVRHPGLDTCRPEAQAFSERPAVGDETLPARLWQDPLQTAYGAYESFEAGEQAAGARSTFEVVLALLTKSAPPAVPPAGAPLDASAVASRVAKRLSDKEQVLVLPVFVSGETYSEDAENRLRTRYAVLGALSAAGYIPADRKHIGYFTMDYQDPEDDREQEGASGAKPADGREAGECTGSMSRKFIIPFEWYGEESLPAREKRQRAACGFAEHVLVLWIDEDHLGDKPLAALGEIVDRLRSCEDSKDKCSPQGQEAKLAVKVIGPTTSDVLVEMLREVHEGPADRLADVRFYSQRPTICEELLQEKLCKSISSPCVPSLLKRLNLCRTIADDRALCDLLVEELGRRWVRSSRSDAHVALIAEWDTAYARALPETFARAYERGGGQGGSRESVRFFTYLQGIDGQVPGEEQVPKQRGPGEARDEVVTMERPEGKAQLDHIRRLEGQLKWWNRKLKRDGSGQLQAIGILGSDVYDKLLILRALRPSFPGVIFFTTDLDARLLHPDEQKWTRNLIVASSFGLRLCDDLQGSIPPFRGCYQTSDFFATLLALKPEPWKEDTPCDLSVCQTFSKLHSLKEYLEERSPERNSIVAPAVRVYETARSGAYDLSLKEKNKAGQEKGKDTPSAHPPSPRDEPWLIWTRFVLILMAAICLSVLLLLLSRALRDRFRGPQEESQDKNSDSSAKYNRRLRIAVYAALLSVVAVCVVIWLDQTRQNGEPFALFQGISVWPTELLRLASFLISVFCFIAIAHRLAENKAEVEKLLASGEGADRDAPGGRQSSNGGSASSEGSNEKEVKDAVGPGQSGDGRSARAKGAENEGSLTWWQRACNSFVKFLNIVLLPREAAGDVQALWQGYLVRGVRRDCMIRVATLFALYMGMVVPTFVIFPPPSFPGRGDWSLGADRVMLSLSVASLIMLLFVILDITRLCNWFVRHLLESETLAWPDKVREDWGYGRGLPRTDVDEWLSIRLIARHTAVVGRFIYYPFIVLFILFISRHQVFDRWDWPLPLVAVMMFVLLVAVYAAIVLRSSAKRARREALARLRERVAAALDPERVKRLERLIGDVENERGGGFSGFMENPVVRAIVVPSGGLGVLAVLELLAKAF